jgi:tRNA dimethylallyltransferase
LQPSVFCLVGPTAVGKTQVAVRVMEEVGGTIVSADARQVYRFLDVGTSKPAPELRQRVSFAMIDLITPDQRYSAADFARDARSVVQDLQGKGIPFMLVGGAGLYLKALFQPFFELPHGTEAAREALTQLNTAVLYDELKAIDPETARRIHPHDRQRTMRALEVFEVSGKTMTQLRAEQAGRSEFTPVYVGLDLPRSLLHERIDARCDEMVAHGLIEEVQNLMRMGYSEHTPGLDAIGYQEVLGYLAGRLTLDAAIALFKKNSRAYAKRQMTWFRHQPGIVWVDAQDSDRAIGEVKRRLV